MPLLMPRSPRLAFIGVRDAVVEAALASPAEVVGVHIDQVGKLASLVVRLVAPSALVARFVVVVVRQGVQLALGLVDGGLLARCWL